MSIHDFLLEDSLDVTDEDIGEFLISVITRGLYIEPHIILREYIQNSHDAITQWNTIKEIGEVGKVEILIEHPNIHIIDNGPGMTKSELVASMRKIGISSKPIGNASGFMGIGKLAGLSMADKVYITSSKYGVPEKNRVVFYGEEMQQAIDERRRKGDSRPIAETLKSHSHINLNPMPEAAEKHYTAIHLLGIDEDYWKAINDREVFLKKLGLVAPVRQDPNWHPHAATIENYLESIGPQHYSPLEIYVNGVALYRPWYNNLQSPREIEVLDASGNQIAYGWVCRHTESEQIPDPLLQGIALLQRGISIGERGLAENLGLYGPNPLYFKWHTGEIYITDPEVLLTANRMSMRRDERANDLLQRLKQELRKISRSAEKFSKEDNAKRKAPIHMETIQKIERNVINQILNRELVPSTVSQLASARKDLERRKRFLPDDMRYKADDSIQVADKLISQLTSARNEVTNDSAMGTDIQTSDKSLSEGDITVLEEEHKEIFSIPERLNFSAREQLIFQTIVEAIAEASGGWETRDFARYLQKIQEFLYAKFSTSNNQ